jgi:hypothetical protein
VTLLAPRTPGAALEGKGGSDVDHLIAWDRPEVASLLAEEGVPPGALRDQLESHQAAIVYSRNATLRRNVEALVAKVAFRDPLPGGSVHASEWYALDTDVVGNAAPGEPPLLEPSPADRAEAEPVLRRLSPDRARGFLAIHPGSGSPVKSWPPERFARVAEALAGGRPWLVVEGPADTAAVATLERHAGAVVARGLSVRGLGAVLAKASLYAGNDSGVSHLAAAHGVPTIALFGPTDPQVWSPVGPHVEVVRSADGTMEGIPVEAVLDTAKAIGPAM